MALEIRKSGAPEEVHAFLMQDWSRLLTGIYQAHGNRHGDWKADWETDHAPLWSLAPKTGKAETVALPRIPPTLLARPHAGCAALGMEPRVRDDLLCPPGSQVPGRRSQPPITWILTASTSWRGREDASGIPAGVNSADESLDGMTGLRRTP